VEQIPTIVGPANERRGGWVRKPAGSKETNTRTAAQEKARIEQLREAQLAEAIAATLKESSAIAVGSKPKVTTKRKGSARPTVVKHTKSRGSKKSDTPKEVASVEPKKRHRPG
jgi:hypothetical protein